MYGRNKQTKEGEKKAAVKPLAEPTDGNLSEGQHVKGKPVESTHSVEEKGEEQGIEGSPRQEPPTEDQQAEVTQLFETSSEGQQSLPDLKEHGPGQRGEGFSQGRYQIHTPNPIDPASERQYTRGSF